MASTSRASARSTVPASTWAWAADSFRSARRLLVGRQLRRTFQQGRRRGVATTAPGPVRCRLQLGRDSFVGPGGGRGKVPGAGNRVELGIAGVRQRAVDLALLGRGGRVVDRRPDERVEEPHLGPEDHQPGGLRRRGGALGNAQRGGRLPQEVSLARGARRREQQQRLRVRGQLPHAPQE